MKKSEKLLDAIGQIDDRLVEEAGRAGREASREEEPGAFLSMEAQSDEKSRKAADKRNKGTAVKKRAGRNKRARARRWQGALAACAVLAICVGIFGLLGRSGMLLSPFDKNDALSGAAEAELAVDTTADEPKAASGKAEENMAGSLAMDMADAVASDAPEASAENAPSANESARGKNEVTDEDGGASMSESILMQGNDGSTESKPAAQDVVGAEEAGEREAAGQELCSLPKAEAEKKRGTLEQVIASAKTDGAGSVSIVIKNTGNRDIIFGSYYEVEQLADGSWQALQPVTEAAWTDVEYRLEAGDTWEETIQLAPFYGELEPGQYRIVKYCELAASKPPEEMETYAVYTEFTVSE